MEDPENPRPPPPLKYINSPLLSLLPRYAWELINAMWYVMFSQEPLRYERVALAYHGFRIGDYFSPDDCLHVRQVERPECTGQLVVKRVSDGFQSEINMLKMLSRKSMDSYRNHIAAPSHILWGQRMHITPLYHQFIMISFTPNGVLNMAHQLIEAVGFLHEHRIAHLVSFLPTIQSKANQTDPQDVSPRNLLLARNPILPKLRLLLMDMEFAVHLPPNAEPVVDLWHNCRAPPEGKTSVNAFAYDMLGVGYSIMSFIQDCTLDPAYSNIQWPEPFCALYKQLSSNSPERRPSAKEAETIIQQIDKDPFPDFPGSSSQSDLILRLSVRMHPALAEPTPLPFYQDFETESRDW